MWVHWQEVPRLIEALEDVSLRMHEALVAGDLLAFSALIARRHSFINGLASIEAEKIPTGSLLSPSEKQKLSNKLDKLVLAGDRLLAAVETLRKALLEKRRQSSVARTALRSYLAGDEVPIQTRVIDG